MITFYIVSAAMIAVALVLLARPLLKSPSDETAKPNASRRGRLVAVISMAILVPLITTMVYRALGRPHWQQEIEAAKASAQPANLRDVQAMVAKLEARLHEQPNDIEGWIMLGRSYVTLENIPSAIAAYEKAYQQSNGENLEATLGLAEALVFADEKSLSGKAGELFDAVLVKQPNNPKALWYGAVSELSRGNLPSARDRLQRMLQLNPPESIRSILEHQVQDINQQLAQAGSAAAPPRVDAQASDKTPKSSVASRSLQVDVKISPQLLKSLDKTATLFVLARDPKVQGPPLAVRRLTAAALPLSIALSDADAMLQGHGIGSVDAVQVVARISKSGTPQAQSGDLFGEASFTFLSGKSANKADKAKVNIVIDRIVP